MKLRFAAVAWVLVALAVTACSSGGGGDGNLVLSPEVDLASDAQPFTGDARVTWMNLDPDNPAAVLTLVNESSEPGQYILRGEASSTSIRVMTDKEMGVLLGTMQGEGFFDHATAGLGTKTVGRREGLKGIVVVQQDGRDFGLVLERRQGGTPVPGIYQKCKALILATHGQIQGLEVRVDADEKVFDVPPIRPGGGR